MIRIWRGKEPADLAKARLAAISPLTAGALNEAGHIATVVAEVYTSRGLVAAIHSHIGRS